MRLIYRAIKGFGESSAVTPKLRPTGPKRRYNYCLGENMIQREIQDQQNTRWQCVQALSQNDALAEKADEIQDDDVTIVCTPSGGEQTVRVRARKGWNETLSDEQLLELIEQHRKK